jgi:hypothetical protein
MRRSGASEIRPPRRLLVRRNTLSTHTADRANFLVPGFYGSVGNADTGGGSIGRSCRGGAGHSLHGDRGIVRADDASPRRGRYFRQRACVVGSCRTRRPIGAGVTGGRLALRRRGRRLLSKRRRGRQNECDQEANRSRCGEHRNSRSDYSKLHFALQFLTEKAHYLSH